MIKPDSLRDEIKIRLAQLPAHDRACLTARTILGSEPEIAARPDGGIILQWERGWERSVCDDLIIDINPDGTIEVLPSLQD